MKLPLFYTHDFWPKPFRPNLEGVEETDACRGLPRFSHVPPVTS